MLKNSDTDLSSLTKYYLCSVVEGSLIITAAAHEVKTGLNYSMPNLVEVTDYVVFFKADEIKSFRLE